jgi:hypothetical protein
LAERSGTAGGGPPLTRIGSGWLSFLRVVSWIGFGVLMLRGAWKMIDVPLDFSWVVWFLAAFVALAVSMVNIDLARDVSAIRAKSYAPSADGNVGEPE